MVYAVHILACIVYNDIHNAWVPVCGTLCILYQDHKLDSVCLLLTTYLQSAVVTHEIERVRAEIYAHIRN